MFLWEKRCPLKPDKLLFDFLIIWWDLSKYTRRKMQIQSKNKGGDFTDWTNHEIKSPEFFWKFEKYKYSLRSVDKIQSGKILPIRLCLSLFQNDHAIYSFYSDQYFWGDRLTLSGWQPSDFCNKPEPLKEFLMNPKVCSFIGAITVIFMKGSSWSLTHFYTNGWQNRGN